MCVYCVCVCVCLYVRMYVLQMKKAEEKQYEQAEKKGVPDFSAIRSLHDPQTFAEKLFGALKRSNEVFNLPVLYVLFIAI